MNQPPSQSAFDRQASPTRIVLIYACFAALWIILSGLFLSFSVQDPLLHNLFEYGKGLLFVAVTSVLLHQLIKRSMAGTVRMTHLYSALSQCNQAIVHSRNEQELFPRVCKAAVENGGMKMAWIGMVEPASGRVRPVAVAGAGGEDYLRDIRITVNPNETWGHGPVGTAIRENRPVWVKDFRHDPMLAPWRKSGQSYGWNSVSTLPLHRNGRAVGALVLYADNASAFDEAARNLLFEMAQDIGFALDNFDLEEAHARAEQQARSAQVMIRHFLDNLPGTAYIKDSSLRVLMANRGFRAILGLDPDAMVGKTNHDLFPQEFADKISADDRRVLATGKTETLFEEYGGKYFETTKFVMSEEAGSRLLGGITIDTTPRHLLMLRQQALLELHELVLKMPETELLNRGLGFAQRLTASSQAFLHFVSADQQMIDITVCSENATPVMCSADQTRCPVSEAGSWARCIADRKAMLFNDYSPEMGIRGLPESGLPIRRLVAAPVIEEGRVRIVIGVMGKSQDYDEADRASLQLIGNDLWRIASHKRAEQAINQQLVELKALNQKLEESHNQLVQSEKLAAIGQLSASIAHEINNPISFIQSNFSSLSDYVDDLLAVDAAYAEIERQHGGQMPQAFRDVRQVKQAVGHDFIISDLRQLVAESREGLARVSNIVQDLRNFSRVGETGWQWTDLHEGIRSTLNIVCTVVHRDVEFEPGELPLVHCIPAQLNQVFLNLLVNAAQSISGSGRVVIRTRTEGDQVVVEVEDNGSGMDPEIIERLFEPYFTTKPAGQGTGLGLSLSRSIVQRHKGNIEVESKPGQGTVFRVMLPVDPMPTP